MSEFWKWNATKVSEKVLNREISARDIVYSSLKRLDEVNNRINAVVQLMPDLALKEADRIDSLLSKGIYAKETHHSTVRLAPALTISAPQIDILLTAIAEVIKDI